MASALLEPSTLAALGISTQPFVAPGQDGLYVDEALDLQVRLLRHNLQYSAMLQVLCGPAGAGKTTLIIRLVDLVNQELELFVARGDSDLDAERIVADMLQALEPAHDGTGDVAHAFAKALTANSEVDAPAALVVDDAHLLPVRELSRLLALCARIDEASANGLRVLLVGEPQLKHLLEGVESPLLKPGRVFVADVEPLSEQQAQSYLAHRLAGVGATWPFDDEELAAIHDDAGGLPGRIDEVAATTLNHRHSRGRLAQPEPSAPARPDPPPSQRRAQARTRSVAGQSARRPLHLRRIAAALLAVLAVWWLWPDTGREPEPVEQFLPIPEPPTPRVVFKDELPEQAAATAGTDAGQTPAPRPGKESASADGASESAESEPAAPTGTLAPAAVARSEAPQEARSTAPAEAPAAPAKAVAAGGPGSTPAATRPAAATATAPVSPVSAPAASATPTPTPTTATTPTTTPARRAEAWLLAQPANRYVVQLVAMRDLGALRKFIQRHDLGAQGAVFTTRREGAAWHVLVYGSYSNANSARAAIAKLPAALRRNSPWIRSFASVHKAIRNQTP